MTPRRTLIRLTLVGCFFAIAACSATRRPIVEAQNVLITHDVRNLVLPNGAEEANRVRLDTLVANIKAATGPRYWGGRSGSSIELIEGGYGYVLVKAVPAMQRKVTAFLDDLDRLTTGADGA
jgi:hypothetical protein